MKVSHIRNGKVRNIMILGVVFGGDGRKWQVI